MSLSSPIKPRKTAPTQIRLDKARKNALWDLNETVPEVTTLFFRDNLLPPSPLPEGMSLEDVLSSLRSSKTIRKTKGVENWAGWARPGDTDGREDEVFRGFAKLTDQIQKASQIPKEKQTIKFRCNPPAASMNLSQ